MLAFVAHLGLAQMIALAGLPLLVVALVVIRRRAPIAARPRPEVTVTEQIDTRRSRRLANGSTPPPFTAASFALPRVVQVRSKRKTGLRPTHARR